MEEAISKEDEYAEIIGNALNEMNRIGGYPTYMGFIERYNIPLEIAERCMHYAYFGNYDLLNEEEEDEES